MLPVKDSKAHESRKPNGSAPKLGTGVSVKSTPPPHLSFYYEGIWLSHLVIHLLKVIAAVKFRYYDGDEKFDDVLNMSVIFFIFGPVQSYFSWFRPLRSARRNDRYSDFVNFKTFFCSETFQDLFFIPWFAVVLFRASPNDALLWSITASQVLWSISCIYPVRTLIAFTPGNSVVDSMAALSTIYGKDERILNAAHSILADAAPEPTRSGLREMLYNFDPEAETKHLRRTLSSASTESSTITDFLQKYRSVGRILCCIWLTNTFFQVTYFCAATISSGYDEEWGFLALFSLVYCGYSAPLLMVVWGRSLSQELQNNPLFDVILLKYTWLFHGMISLLIPSAFSLDVACEMLAEEPPPTFSNEIYLALVSCSALLVALNVIVSAVMWIRLHRLCPAATLLDLRASFAAITVNDKRMTEAAVSVVTERVKLLPSASGPSKTAMAAQGILAV